jgi:hypothetical protein
MYLAEKNSFSSSVPIIYVTNKCPINGHNKAVIITIVYRDLRAKLWERSLEITKLLST